MFSLIATIAKFLAGLIDLVQHVLTEQDEAKQREAGRLEEQAKEQAQKETDEAVASQVDARPVPVDKHRILDGM